MKLLLMYGVVVLAGVLNSIHSGTNAQLTRSLSQPWWCALIVCVISGLATAAGILITREPPPVLSAFAATPWWAWAGTVIAAVPIITTLYFAGPMGAAAYNGVVVTSTIVSSLLLDHLGAIGFTQHTAGLWRILGGALMIGGLTLICLF
ncbi:DMT family transporter [Rhizosaccharibacter radicis]|uniref:DMT family transporter n=1 Tax=Rhizosaccharibacter radicis TaxID=2782605 RepID=A0ABT1VTX4_9PROT|nr:DMT family transporter [Acetobacteraceae bacterium KSS12]